jgi:hypothetical protein
LTVFYLVVLLAAALANYAFAVAILKELSAAGKNTPFFDLRWFVFRNLKIYREISRARHGRVGCAYYGYLATFALLILSAVLFFGSLAH